MAYLNFCLQFFATISMSIVFEGNVRGGYKRSANTNLFFLMLLSDILMLFTGALDNYVLYRNSFYEKHKWVEALLSGISDMAYFLVLCFFILYLDIYAREGKKISVPALVGSIVSAVYGVFWFVAGFVGGIYTQDADSIAYESLYMIGQIGGYVTGLLSVSIFVRRWKEFNRRERIGFAMFIFVPLIGSLFKGIFKNITIMPILVTISIVFIHSFIQMNRELLLRQQETDFAIMQADLIMNRLKPHFIYNVLNTIYALCDISADKTKQAISMFAGYLRTSLVDIDSHRLIPFEEELENVRNYLKLEKLRFGDKIDVGYDIRTVDFTIPPLTLMTIVENAVRHGIEKKPGGGRIIIASGGDENGYFVKVSDNGDGFDTSSVSLSEFKTDENGRRHVGLYSTAYRLKNMCNGSLKLDSSPGEGTVVTLEIKGGSIDEDSGSR